VVAEAWNARHWFGGLFASREPSARNRALGYENPDVIVVLFAGKVARVNSVDLQVLVRCQRWNQLALSGMRIEFPAVIAALDLPAIKLSTRERHATMGTRVLQSEGASLPITPNDHRDFQQRGFDHMPPRNVITWQAAIPKTKEHHGIRAGRFWTLDFRHLNSIEVYKSKEAETDQNELAARTTKTPTAISLCLCASVVDFSN